MNNELADGYWLIADSQKKSLEPRPTSYKPLAISYVLYDSLVRGK
jgi:hypothetical protein